MTKCIIIDDEENCRIALEQLLKQNHPDVEVVLSASDALKTYELIQRKEVRADIIFLDIQMPNCGGFEFLQKFEKVPFGVIFTTAFDQYAVKAIKYSALDYLLKPIDEAELRESLERFKRAKKNNNKLLNEFSKNVKANKLFEKLAVPSLNEISFVALSEICYLKSDNNYTIITTTNERQFTSSRNIGYYEEILSEHSFFRIHNSYIINLGKVVRYVRGKSGFVEMQDGTTIAVSTRRKEEFLELLQVG